MTKLFLLAILAAVPALAQITAWPPVVGTGAINVNPSAPDSTLNVAANGDVQIGTRSSLSMADLNTLNGYIGGNLVSFAGNFKYATSAPAEWIQFAAGDLFFRTGSSGIAGNVVVPLTAFQIKNGAPNGSMLLDASGNLTVSTVKSTTGTRYVCADTTGKLVSSATACSGT